MRHMHTYFKCFDYTHIDFCVHILNISYVTWQGKIYSLASINGMYKLQQSEKCSIISNRCYILTDLLKNRKGLKQNHFFFSFDFELWKVFISGFRKG